MVGLALTVTNEVGSEMQVVELRVNINVTVPDESPVTIPSLVTVAMVLSLLAHVPPADGDKVVVEPMQILLCPVILVSGFELTDTLSVGFEVHPVAVSVNVKVATPILTPVTSPELFTEAMDGLLLAQVPPEDGDKVVVSPSQMVRGPE